MSQPKQLVTILSSVKELEQEIQEYLESLEPKSLHIAQLCIGGLCSQALRLLEGTRHLFESSISQNSTSNYSIRALQRCTYELILKAFYVCFDPGPNYDIARRYFAFEIYSRTRHFIELSYANFCECENEYWGTEHLKGLREMLDFYKILWNENREKYLVLYGSFEGLLAFPINPKRRDSYIRLLFSLDELIRQFEATDSNQALIPQIKNRVIELYRVPRENDWARSGRTIEVMEKVYQGLKNQPDSEQPIVDDFIKTLRLQFISFFYEFSMFVHGSPTTTYTFETDNQFDPILLKNHLDLLRNLILACHLPCLADSMSAAWITKGSTIVSDLAPYLPFPLQGSLIPESLNS
jgi:hypothetical protein